ncbi:MAG: hypothetical protein AB4290_24960 [Spirulina sp.]
MTTLTLNPQELQLTAKVANWDCFETQTYTASDIESVEIRENIVFLHFTNETATAIDTETFKAKIAEFKAKSQLSEEQQEIVEAAIDSPFQSDVNFVTATASFYSDEHRFMGTVRRDGYIWTAITESNITVHKTAESAVQSLTTCTFEEWEEAKAGLEGIRYLGNGYWQHTHYGRINTTGLLDYLGLEKSPCQIAILEKEIAIAD